MHDSKSGGAQLESCNIPFEKNWCVLLGKALYLKVVLDENHPFVLQLEAPHVRGSDSHF